MGGMSPPYGIQIPISGSEQMKQVYSALSLMVVLGSLFVGTTQSQGAITTFDFTADISGAGFDLIGAGFSSNTLMGSYTFDDATADADGSAGTGSYLGALTSLSFADIGANNTGTATNGDITVIDGVTDSYGVFADTGDGLVGTTNAAGYSLDSFSQILADNSGTGFGDDSLPSTPPSLGDFPDIQSITLGLRFDAFTVNNAIYTITSLQAADPGPGRVPEPLSAAIWSLLGLCVATSWHRRQRVG
jgi:hypothetical protein